MAHPAAEVSPPTPVAGASLVTEVSPPTPAAEAGGGGAAKDRDLADGPASPAAPTERLTRRSAESFGVGVVAYY